MMSEEKKPAGTAEVVQPPDAAQAAAADHAAENAAAEAAAEQAGAAESTAAQESAQAGTEQNAAGAPGASEQTAAAQKAAAEEKKPLSDAKKNALLRYMAVLFAAAFLFVLVSLIMQQSSSRAQIGALNESNASALSRAEQLQTQNRDLQQEVESLKQQVAEQEELAAQVEALQDELEALKTQAQTDLDRTADAYNALITALQCTTHEGNVTFSKAMGIVEKNQEYLSQEAQLVYAALLAE